MEQLMIGGENMSKFLLGILAIVTVLSIFGIMPLLQGLYLLIAARDSSYLDKWRWYIGIPSAILLFIVFVVL